MFCLVRFDDGAYSIVSSDRVSVIQDKDCQVKWKSGARYRAVLIQTSDSKEQLRKCQECHEVSVSSDSTARSIVDHAAQEKFNHSSELPRTNQSHEIQGLGCSTPEKISLPPPDELTLSNISFNITSADSSAAPSCTDILNVVGKDWLDEFDKTTGVGDVCLVEDTNDDHVMNSNNNNFTQQLHQNETPNQKPKPERSKQKKQIYSAVQKNINRKQDNHKEKQNNADDQINNNKKTDHSKTNNNKLESNNQWQDDIDEGYNNDDEESSDDDDVDEEYTDDNDDTVEDSNYLPNSNTFNTTFRVSGVNSTKNLSRSFIDASPLDVRSVTIPASKNQTVRSTKKYFCPFCKILQTKFARHLELKHRNEADVKKFLTFPKGNHERAKIIETMRKYGNFLHNTDKSLNTGILITCRQRQAKYVRSVEDYVCCSTCKGFFSKQTLRLHSKTCNPTHKKGVRDFTVMGRRLTGYIHELAEDVLRRIVFPVLRDDEVTRSIKYDELLILFANKLCNKYTHVHQHDMIRAQLRLLGRFKLAIKNINTKVDDFASIFRPEFYDSAVLAVRECAHYDSVTQTYKTPAVATMLGTLLRKCISRQKAQCIKKQDYEGKKAAEDFLILFEDDFPTTVSKKVVEDQTKQKRQKQVTLPSKQDIRKLYDYLKNKCEASLITLEAEFNLSAWKDLTECTLILVQIFNRRRAGEIERLSISDFENRTEIDENVNGDLFHQLSDESQQFAKQFARLTIRGKLGRTVPVLLYPLHVVCLETILKYRSEAGVTVDNEYIFSVPTFNPLKKKYLRACILMRKFSQECGAVMPCSLRGTTLRKHIATFFAMEGIGENQVADLANFMGHHQQIHKEFYRVPVPIREITQVSRLLQTAMGESECEGNSEGTSEDDDDVLDEIPQQEISQSNSYEERSTNSIEDGTSDDSEMGIDEMEKTSSNRRSTSPYGKTKRVRWSTQEKNAVNKIFGDPAKCKKLPSLEECQKAIRNCKTLKNRQPQVLKTWIDNQRKSESRRKVVTSRCSKM
ncbi:uncharacterized protein [Neodiprion pinetum]|uniref:uncharacterized protein n=1 Tax=Neodiprion pinetum TaxID=441929 RepID=UPI00371A016D